MRSIQAQLQLLLFAALLYTSGSGGLRYHLGQRLTPSLQDIVNAVTDSPLTNSTAQRVNNPDVCCWDEEPSLPPTVVLRPSHPDEVPDTTWADTLRTATWRALGEGSGRSPPWQELSVAQFPTMISRPPPPPDREVALLARGVLVRGSDDKLRFSEECVCDGNNETVGVIATWAVRRLRHSGPNQFHRPYYELQFSASALLPPFSRPVTVLPPAGHGLGQAAPVPKGIVFNLTGIRKDSLPPDADQSTRLPVASIERDVQTTVKTLVDSTRTSSTTPNLETAAAEDPFPVIVEPSSTPVSLETADPLRVPDPSFVIFDSTDSTPPSNSTKPDLVTLFAFPPTRLTTATLLPKTSSTQATTSRSTPPAVPTSLETFITSPVTSPSTSTEASTPVRQPSPFRVSLLTTPTLEKNADLITHSPTTFRPPWRPRVRGLSAKSPRSKFSIIETRTTYKVSAERKLKRPL